MTDRLQAPPRVVLARFATEPPAPWHDMASGLRDRYAANLIVLKRSQLTSPATARTAITAGLEGHGGVLLLVVTATVTRFTRKDGDVWSLVLPNSTPGRPKSMIRLEDLINTAASAAGGRPLLVGLDATIQPDIPAGKEGSAGTLAKRLVVACRDDIPIPAISIIVRASSIEHRASSIEHRASSIEHRASSIEHRASSIEHRASSIEHVLDRVLAARAAAGECSGLDVVAAAAADLVRALGGDAHTLPSRAGGVVRPLTCRPTLPAHIRTDLFAPDDGSRLDAALELARLADDGHEYARFELTDLARRDPSAQVRDYAELLARRSAQPTLAALRWRGRVPTYIYDAAKHDPFLPEFRRQPGGTVPIGTDGADPDEAPRHQVEVAPFWLSRTPITDRQYLTFLIATGGPCPDHWETQRHLWDRDVDRPVVMVSFHDARRYCEWLDTVLRDRRLLGETDRVIVPSEVEWESAAGNGRGDRYPWGARPNPALCNIRATGLRRPTSVGTFSPGGDNAAGCADLIGNVWEWTRSAWGPSYRTATHGYPYDAADGREDPDLPGVRRVVRGGAFYYATECADNHTRNRVVAEQRHPGGGFRVAITRGPQ